MGIKNSVVLLLLKCHYQEIRNVLSFFKKYSNIKKALVCGKFLQIINYCNSARGAAAFLLTPGTRTHSGWVEEQ